MMKYIIIGGWITLTAVFFLCIGFASSKHNVQPFTGYEVSIKDSDGGFFIEEQDIMNILNDKSPLGKGLSHKAINIPLLEKIIRNNPYVANAEVYSTIDGRIHVKVEQREPVIRLVNLLDEQYYIDVEGNFMPLSKNYTAHVIVANGRILDPFTTHSIQRNAKKAAPKSLRNISAELFETAVYLRNDPFWKAQISQIYVNESVQLELIPKVGDHRILIGTPENLEQKLNNLMLFYENAIHKTGWNRYKTINLKFDNQVVCTLRDQQQLPD